MLLGVLYIAAASFLFGVIPSGNNYVLLQGMEADCLLCYQTVTMVLGAACLLTVKKISIQIPIQDIAELFVLGAVGMGVTDYLLNLAYELLPVSTVVMLHFLYPAIVLVISCGVFHQGISVLSAGAVVLSIFGLILVGGLQGGVSLQGIIFALGSALSYAFFVTANQHGQVIRLPLMVKLFYMSLITMIIYLMKTGFSRHFSLPSDFKTGAIAIGVVGLGSLLAFYLITAGIKQIGARKASFLNMLEPVAGVVLSVLIYRESFPLRSLIGCLCIVGSVLFIAFDSRESTD